MAPSSLGLAGTPGCMQRVVPNCKSLRRAVPGSSNHGQFLAPRPATARHRPQPQSGTGPRLGPVSQCLAPPLSGGAGRDGRALLGSSPGLRGRSRRRGNVAHAVFLSFSVLPFRELHKDAERSTAPRAATAPTDAPTVRCRRCDDAWRRNLSCSRRVTPAETRWSNRPGTAPTAATTTPTTLSTPSTPSLLRRAVAPEPACQCSDQSSPA